MTFIKGTLCELRVLDPNDAHQVSTFTTQINLGLTTSHLFTGSIPMRDADYAGRWRHEIEEGDILFGIWLPTYVIASQDRVEKRVEARFIGTCGLHSHRDIYRSWEARWLIFDADAVGKGIGKEAVKLLTKYAFHRLNAHRVWLGVSEHNLRAVKCYLDCGFRFEGLLRDEIFYNGNYHGAIRMSILESERCGIEH